MNPMSLPKQLLRSLLIGLAALVLITGCLAWFPGVWLPDMAGGVSELCSAESSTGDKFKITQFWGNDFYTTRFDHWSPDGSSLTYVLEGDARKQWSCSMQLNEPDQRLIIDLHDGHELIDYRWAEKRFIMPPGRQRLRD
jgi:hypothetical protein